MRVIRVERHAVSLSHASQARRGSSENNRVIVLVDTLSTDDVELYPYPVRVRVLH